MDTPAKSARTNLAIQVYKQAQTGMTVRDACKEVGLPRSSFYSIVDRNPEILLQFQEAIRASEFVELFKILKSKMAIVDKTLEDAFSASTSPRERLAIAKWMDDRIEELTKKYGGSGGNDKAARDVLTGPVREQAQSRFGGEPHRLP